MHRLEAIRDEEILMRSILPFDEINTFSIRLRQWFPTGRIDKKHGHYEDILDEMLDLFLLSYALGNDVTNESLLSDWEPTLDDVMETVDKKVAGKTWRERTEEYFVSGGSVDDLIRIVETETHRDANEAALKTATYGGAKTKTWVTMLDDRVRDTHQYLESVTVGMDEDFYTFDGDHTPAPGLFSLPENNINCRCQLRFN